MYREIEKHITVFGIIRPCSRADTVLRVFLIDLGLARATSSATRRKPRSQPDILAVSGRTPGRRTLQLAADEHLAGGINAVDLED
jgi:hypothetical protein